MIRGLSPSWIAFVRSRHTKQVVCLDNGLPWLIANFSLVVVGFVRLIPRNFVPAARSQPANLIGRNPARAEQRNLSLRVGLQTI